MEVFSNKFLPKSILFLFFFVLLLPLGFLPMSIKVMDRVSEKGGDSDDDSTTTTADRK